jgi:hypothetical protein
LKEAKMIYQQLYGAKNRQKLLGLFSLLWTEIVQLMLRELKLVSIEPPGHEDLNMSLKMFCLICEQSDNAKPPAISILQPCWGGLWGIFAPRETESSKTS